MDPAATELEGVHQSQDGGKVRKTRRRPKLSCIPCAKRRQKCDRAQPCSLCIAKGTPHLCKLESIPDGLGKPRLDVDLTGTVDFSGGAVGVMEDRDVDEDDVPPALKNTKLDLNENKQMIKMLSMRIKSLENRVVASSSSSTGSRSRPSTSLAQGVGVFSMDSPTRIGAGGSGGGGGEGSGFFPGVNVGGIPVVGSMAYPDMMPAGCVTGSVSLHEVSPSNTSISFSPASTQSPQIRDWPRPQATRWSSDANISFRVEPPPQETSANRLAGISLGHRGEFVGRASLLHTFNSTFSTSAPRLEYARSTESMSVSPIQLSKFAQSLLPSPQIQHLIQYIPPMQSGNQILDAFFRDVNWRYGIPEKWFHGACSQMWIYLQNSNQSHGQQLNLHWLCLLFSILACAPQPSESSVLSTRLPNTHESSTYFICAHTARRLAEDSYLDQSISSSVSTPADGSVLGCLAIPLLCDFLAERGRVSEAWKLVGNGVRYAQAVGMHRDPESEFWHDMPEDEKVLRRRAWWGLYIWDMLYSSILGRPQIIRKEIVDVLMPSAGDHKGHRSSANQGQEVMIQLANLIGEALDKCTNTDYPACAIVEEMDEKFRTWEAGIPAEYRSTTTQEQDIILFVGLSPVEIQKFTRQRYMVTTWYRLSRLKLYAAALPGPHSSPSSTQQHNVDQVEKCAEKCILFALELVKYQCDTFDRMKRTKLGDRWLGSNWYFEGCLSLFEAALALLTALTKFPARFLVTSGGNVVDGPREGLKLEYEEMARVLSRVVDVFSEVVKNERGDDGMQDGKRAEIASRALDALQVLTKEHWWKLDPRGEVTWAPIQVEPGGLPGVESAFSSLASSPTTKGSPAGVTVVGTLGRSGSGVLQGGLDSGPPVRNGLVGQAAGMAQQFRPKGKRPGMMQVYSSAASPIDAPTVQPVPQHQTARYQPYPAVYGNSPDPSTMAYGSPYVHPDPPSYVASELREAANPNVSLAPYAEGTNRENGTDAPGFLNGYFSPNQPHFPQLQDPSGGQQTPSNVGTPMAMNGPQSYGLEFPVFSNQQYHQIPQQLPPPPQLSTRPYSNLNELSTLTSTSGGYNQVSPGVPQPLPAEQNTRVIHYDAPLSTPDPNSGFSSVFSSVMPLGSMQPPSTGLQSDFGNEVETGTGVGGPEGAFYKQ